MPINWYFKRTDLAETIADDYTDIGKDYIALSADRQKGKTTFCLNDLIPEMKSRGYFSIYVGFGPHKENPAQAFVVGVAEAYDALGVLQKPLTVKTFKLKKTRKTPFKTKHGANADSPELAMAIAGEAINHLLKFANHKPVFIVLDEAQHLATNRAYQNFTAKLRSFLINKATSCKYPVKAMFIGSDQARLVDLFNSRESPFFGAANVVNFPDLGRSFTDYTVGLYESCLKDAKLDRTEAFKLFVDGGKMPGAFSDLIQEIVATGGFDPEDMARELGDCQPGGPAQGGELHSKL